VERYTAAELEAMPTLATGQADDLKKEGEDDRGRFRIWLSRCGVEDGEPYPNKVTVERYDVLTQRWVEDERYPG
jgi:hypothetical protein